MPTPRTPAPPAKSRHAERREAERARRLAALARQEFQSERLGALGEQLLALDRLLPQLDPVQGLAVTVEIEKALSGLLAMAGGLRAALEPPPAAGAQADPGSGI